MGLEGSRVVAAAVALSLLHSSSVLCDSVKKEVRVCSEGWTELKGCNEAEGVCVRFQRPVKFVSWITMQYQCDKQGGYLPEPSPANSDMFNLVLANYEQMYEGKVVAFLGGRANIGTNTWSWVNRKTAVENKWKTQPKESENKDCLAQSGGEWINVGCEDNNMEFNIADVCMKKKEEEKKEAEDEDKKKDAEKPECPAGWTKYETSCILYNETPATWEDAEKKCQESGAHLVVIKDKAHNLALSRIANTFWVGAKKIGNTWTGTDGQKLKYVGWKSGRPDNREGEIYAVSNQDAEWDDQSSAYSQKYFCSKDKN